MLFFSRTINYHYAHFPRTRPHWIQAGSGGTRLAYTTHGRLDAAATNAILVTTFYGGRHADYAGMIGPGRALDPAKYFIVVADMFCNGLSSSPSNTPAPFDGPRFPRITHWDNVHCQHRLLTAHLGVKRLALATGFSMGGQQANHWAAIFPDMVERLAPWCASAKTAPHNRVFLEGVKAALLADRGAGAPGLNAPDMECLDAALRELLAR